MRRADGRARLAFVESWHDEPAFLDVLAGRVRGTDAWVVFTAHSLPERPVVVVGSMRNPSTLGYKGAANLLEGFRVADRDDLVDLIAVEDLGKEREADAFDRVRPLFSSSEDRALGLGGDAEEIRRSLAQEACAARWRPAGCVRESFTSA